MLLQFKLTYDQANKISNQYPAYDFGGDLRDSIDDWVYDNILRGCYVCHDYDKESILPYTVRVHTRGREIDIKNLYLNEVISDFKHVK